MPSSSFVSTATGTCGEALAKIDAEIHALQMQISELLSIRNNIIPVASLPFEILSRIFRLVPVEEGGTSEIQIIMPVAQVSRRWRRVALDNPTFWSRIDRSNIRKARLFLKRSNKMPLSVRLDIEEAERYADAVYDISDSFERIKELTLTCEEGPVHQLYSHTAHTAPLFDTAQDCPILEKLCVHDLELPSMMSATQMPQLRTLELIRSKFACAMFTSTTPLSQLTNLRVVRALSPLHFGDLLNLLASTPLLRHLTLLAVYLSRADVEMTPVHLPFLIKLNISLKGMDQTVNLLNCLRISPSTERMVHVPVYSSEEDHLSTLFSPLMGHFDSEEPTLSLKVVLDYKGPVRLVLSALSSEQSTAPGQVVVQLAPASDEKSTVCNPRVLRKALKDLPLASIQIFEFDSNIQFQSWATDFGSMVALQQLRVREHAALFFFHYLVSKPDVETQLLGLFPALKKLCWTYDYGRYNTVLEEENFSAFCRAAHRIYPTGTTLKALKDVKSVWSRNGMIDSDSFERFLKNWKTLAKNEEKLAKRKEKLAKEENPSSEEHKLTDTQRTAKVLSDAE